MNSNEKQESNASQIVNSKLEPGAARYGNFINYYSFNSVSKRLEAIPQDLSSYINIKSKILVCLDIGCNSGELTAALYSQLVSSYPNCQVFICGIDIDGDLITRCRESNKIDSNITYKQLDIMEETAQQQLKSYLALHDKSEFDLITCFSTTMWIHLNHGDHGLERFLKSVSNLTKYLIIEPQEWKCYRSAVRRMTRLNRENFKIQLLQIKKISTHMTNFLSKECDFNLKQCFGETSWGRKLYLYEKFL